MAIIPNPRFPTPVALPPGVAPIPPIGMPRPMVPAGILGMAPQMHPIFGTPMPAPPQRPTLNIGGLLGQVFGGINDPNLSPEENRRAQQRALLQAGLATMLAAAQPGANALGSLAQGALFGQQVGGDARQQIAQQQAAQMRQQILSVVARTPRDQLPALAQQLFALGMTEEAAGVMKIFEQQRGPGLQQVKTQDGKTLLIDSVTGETVREIAGDIELEARDLGNEIVWYDKRNPSRIVHRMTKGAAPTSGMGRFGRPTEGERKAASFAQFIPEHVAYIDSLERAPGRVAQALSKKGLREFTDAEQQQLQLAGSAIAEAWLRMTTGAAYNAQEFQNAYALFVPQPGDRKETLEMKKRNRERLMQMLRTQSGRAGEGMTMPVPEATTMPVADTPTGLPRPAGLLSAPADAAAPGTRVGQRAEAAWSAAPILSRYR